MKNFWRYFTWVQLELNFIPNIIRDVFMDMSQIKYGEYAENFQFLSKIDRKVTRYRLCGGQFPSERTHEDIHMVFLYVGVPALDDIDEELHRGEEEGHQRFLFVLRHRLVVFAVHDAVRLR